jgi:hypothetical protein
VPSPLLCFLAFVGRASHCTAADDVRIGLAEIAENLHRAELTA